MTSALELEHSHREDAIQRSLEAHTPKIEQLMEIGNTPGVSIAVLCNNKLVLERGYGLVNLRTNSKATASTIYPIASVTKTFTAAACGILVAEGKLSWGKFFESENHDTRDLILGRGADIHIPTRSQHPGTPRHRKARYYSGYTKSQDGFARAVVCIREFEWNAAIQRRIVNLPCPESNVLGARQL
ncbi:hypothetical protein FOVSG1_007024 [Fusarium oxysporum f. sp. vasinfectum]